MKTIVHMLDADDVVFPGDFQYRIDRWGHLALRERAPGPPADHIRAVFPAHRWTYVEWTED